MALHLQQRLASVPLQEVLLGVTKQGPYSCCCKETQQGTCWQPQQQQQHRALVLWCLP
jgi:hypothetical protein